MSELGKLTHENYYVTYTEVLSTAAVSANPQLRCRVSLYTEATKLEALTDCSWLGVLAWQVAVAATSFQAGTQIQGLLVLNYPDYGFERWHGTLLVWAVVTFAVLFNIFLARQLPVMEVLMLVFHLAGFFCVLVPLLVLSDRAPSSVVWTEFFDSGWGSYGTSALVGIIAGIIPLAGADAAAHMSEELHDAAYSLPRSMVYSTAANGALGLIAIVSYCYCVGDILEGKLFDSPRSSCSTLIRRSRINTDGLRFHPTILQRYWLFCWHKCNGFSNHHRHHLLQHFNAGHNIATVVRLLPRQRFPILQVVGTSVYVDSPTV